MSDISFESENVACYSPSTIKSQGQISIDMDNIGYRAQLAKYPVVPALDRPKPVLDWIKGRAPIIPRVKLLGVFGILDPEEEDVRGQRFGAGGYGGRYSVERRIPKPYPVKYAWPVEKPIARIPSVIGTVPSGAMRTVLPQRRDVTRQTQSARISVQI